MERVLTTVDRALARRNRRTGASLEQRVEAGQELSMPAR
jgi:hypothetical protein